MDVTMKIFLIFASLFFTSFAANATVIKFNDFSDTSILTLNSDAQVTNTSDGNVLRLTPAQIDQAGSVFSSATINASNFSTAFSFRITSPGGTIFDCNTEAGADGIVFVVQSVSSSIGGLGVGIGYSGITNSIGVEFDTWCNQAMNDPSSNHVGININGSVNHGSGSPNTVNVTPNFDNDGIWYAWVDYNGTLLEVRVSQTNVRPTTAILTRNLDVPTILGQTSAYVGFTSGTGADWGNHDILSWEYRDQFNPVGAEVTINPTSGLVTTEDGGSALFTVALASQPTSNVTINLNSSDNTEGSIDKNTLTFTPANFSTPQVVTVTGIDDSILDGNVSYSITFSATNSSDPNYNGLAINDIELVNNDNEVAIIGDAKNIPIFTPFGIISIILGILWFGRRNFN
jgi:hypothetical protein